MAVTRPTSNTTVVGLNGGRNDRGTICHAGNKATDSRITSDVGRTLLARNPGRNIIPGPDTDAQIALGHGFHAGVADNLLSGTYQPYAAGTFAYQAAGEYIIMRVTSKLSGVDISAAASYIRSSATFMRPRAIPKMESYRTTHESAWDWVTGKPGTVVTTKDWAGVITTDSTDHAARPSQAIPGELTYSEKGGTPTSDDYPAATQF